MELVKLTLRSFCMVDDVHRHGIDVLLVAGAVLAGALTFRRERAIWICPLGPILGNWSPMTRSKGQLPRLKNPSQLGAGHVLQEWQATAV